MKRKTSLIFLATLMTCSLIGCGSKTSDNLNDKDNVLIESQENTSVTEMVQETNEITSFLEAYKKVTPSDNFHMDMDMNISFTMQSEGLTFEMPMTMDMQSDIYKDNYHSNMHMKMKILGEEIENTSESYGDLGNVYSYDSEEGYWTVSAPNLDDNMLNTYKQINSDFSNIPEENMEIENTDDGYVVTVSFADIDKDTTINDLVTTTVTSMDALLGIEEEELLNSLKNMCVVYNFDNELKLISIVIDDFKFEMKIPMDDYSDANTNFAVIMNYNFKFSEYDKIDASSVKIPEKIVEEAIRIEAEEPSEGESYFSNTTQNDINIDDLKGTYVDMNDKAFYINDKKYLVGQNTLRDLMNDNVPFSKDDLLVAENVLKPNTESTGYAIELGDYWEAFVYVINDTEEAKVAADCIISEIYLPNNLEAKNCILKFNFPRDLSEEELLENAGKPSEYYEYEDGDDDYDYTQHTYEYKVDAKRYFGTSGYEFEYVNGNLKYIYITDRP